MTPAEAGDAVTKIAREGSSEFAPNPTKIFAAVLAARPPFVTIAPAETGAMMAHRKVGDRHYVSATRAGHKAHDDAMRAQGKERIETGQYVRADGRKEVSFVYKKI